MRELRLPAMTPCPERSTVLPARRTLLRNHTRPDRIDSAAVQYLAADARDAARRVGDIESMGSEIIGAVLQRTVLGTDDAEIVIGRIVIVIFRHALLEIGDQRRGVFRTASGGLAVARQIDFDRHERIVRND